ncbi:MAG: hypothetical protein HY242_06835 [Afipia sp.]|nr:hypothetical protein [Afipia sp.]
MADCASSDNLSFTSDRDEAVQVVPPNYRAELLALLKTYLNDPRGIREAMIAEPVLRKIGSRQRYVACMKFNARDSDGSYGGSKERGALFVDGRLDRIIEKPEDMCAGATYAPFPELEKLTR